MSGIDWAARHRSCYTLWSLGLRVSSQDFPTMVQHSLAAFTDAALLFVPRVVAGVLIFLVFWGSARLAARLIVRMPRLSHVPLELTLLLARTAKLSLLAFGIVTALSNLGIHVTALITGLGLTGFAAGFALKDIISNALSGVLLILSRPFKQGDRISIVANAPFSGKVLDINLRYTVMETDESTVYVPNSILFTTAVTVQRAVPAPQPSQAAVTT
ncbi:MAG TPA: mechanosensitive ion channel domain-containing protein [Pirellulales bacterium]|nr:mechanosensitive ion channel domain-containing protein [Pirellulales bacterium]